MPHDIVAANTPFLYSATTHHMKMFLGKFEAKVGTENIFSITTGNKSLHGENGDNIVGVVDFATSGCLLYNLPALKHS